MMKKLLFLCAISTCFAGAAQAQEVDYGADRANKKTLSTDKNLGGRSDYNYLALQDHASASGVPLGGIGAGNVQFAPDGRFVRIGMNNIHMPIAKSKAAFFALWSKTGGKSAAKQLVIGKHAQYGLNGVDHMAYTGLFPQAFLKPEVKGMGVTTTIHAWSSLIPHDVKNSSLPIVYFDVTLEAQESGDFAVAFSWEDFIGRGIKDPKSLKGLEGQILAKGHLMNGEEWPERPAINTYSEAYNGASFSGIRQFAAPIIPKKATFQNYVNEVALLVPNAANQSVTFLENYAVDHGNDAWQSFKTDGQFKTAGQKRNVLSTASGKNGASVISVKTTLKKGEKKTIRFMLAWYYPELIIDKATAAPGSYWAGGSDYGRYFHNYFNSLDAMVNYGITNAAELLQKTSEWQTPVMTSSYPDWYKYKLINSAYVIYTNMILNKKGDVTVNEGGMGGLAGTMDQRISSHPFYQKFFTQLDRSEMEIFGDAQAFDGSINHFIGHYYAGMGTVGGRVPTENHWMLDNTEGWIIQIAKDYEQTGDFRYLSKYADRIKDGMKFLKSKMPAGVEIPVGPTTYDDFTHPPIYSYGAGMYLAALRAAEVVATAMDDQEWAEECRVQFEKSRKDMIRLLWNGRFFAYGCEINGSGRKDNILFTGQLAGEFISRYCGWGDLFPMPLIQASLVSQFKTSLYHTPDYYANKVWDLDQEKGNDQRGSQCWPFYLESYTSYPAIQAGFVADGLDIMKHIQLVHLRKGLTWSQNLWNPGEITYMTGPVTWFSTDVMMGAGLNIPKGELRLAPVLAEKKAASYPIYFPGFWATVHIDSQKKTVKLTVTKTFGTIAATLKTLVIETAGKSTDDRKVVSLPPFKVIAGKTMDLSKWYKDLTAIKAEQAVLPDANAVEFRVWNP